MPRIDPRLALVWRTPTRVQLGVPDAVVVAEVTPDDEVLLSTLRAGTNLSTLRSVARVRGISAARVDEFLELFAPALEPGFDSPPPRLRVGIDGSGTMAEWIAFALKGACEVRRANPRVSAEWMPELVIIVSNYAITPARAALWLRREIPHLGVVVGDRSVRLSNVVTAGVTPCLVCDMFARADADAALAGMLAQLLGKPAGADDVRTCLEVASRISRVVLAPQAWPDVPAQRLETTSGAWTSESTSWSPRCSCRALEESARVPAA